MTLKTLLYVQAGTESSWASPAIATTQLMGLDSFNLLPVVEAALKPDLRASPALAFAAALNNLSAQAAFSGQQLYEDQCYWLDSLMGLATPSGSGPYTRAYAAPITTAGVATPRFLSLYKGLGATAYRLVGGLVSQLTFKGSSKGVAQVSGLVLGQQVQSGVSLSPLSDRAVSAVMGDHLSLYLDSWAGAIGTTPLTATGFSYALSLQTNRSLRHFLNALTPGAWLEAHWGGRLTLTLAFNAATQPTLDALLSGSLQQQQIRLRAANGLGSISQFDFAGTLLESPHLFDDENGQATLALHYGSTYNPNLGNWFKASVTNGLATLP